MSKTNQTSACAQPETYRRLLINVNGKVFRKIHVNSLLLIRALLCPAVCSSQTCRLCALSINERMNVNRVWEFLHRLNCFPSTLRTSKQICAVFKDQSEPRRRLVQHKNPLSLKVQLKRFSLVSGSLLSCAQSHGNRGELAVSR